MNMNSGFPTQNKLHALSEDYDVMVHCARAPNVRMVARKHISSAETIMQQK